MTKSSEDSRLNSAGMNRRQFLAAVGAASAALLAGGASAVTANGQKEAAAAQLAAASQNRPLTQQMLSRHVGSKFRLYGGSKPLTIILERVEEDGTSDMLDQFTAVFRVKGKTSGLSQTTYELIHSELGQFPLMLSPGSAGKQTTLSAKFCHLKGSAG